VTSFPLAHPYSQGCPVQAPLGRGFPRPEPSPKGAGPSVPQHKTGCPTRGSFTGGPLQTFPHVIRPRLNRSRLCSIIPLGWPTLTLKGAPFKLRLGGAFLDPNRPRSYSSLDTTPTASASAYIFSIRSMYRASTTRRRTFMLAVSAPFSGENSSAINITFFNCSKRARF
jgi:hypothetical protein